MFFTEIVVQLNDKRQFHMVKGIINAFDHMEFCLVINLTMASNWANSVLVRYVSFATTFYTR